MAQGIAYRMFQAAGKGIGSGLRVSEWRKTLSFFLCFQSSIRASRGTIGGYFLAGRSMTWWPVSEKHCSVSHDLKAVLDLRKAGLEEDSVHALFDYTLEMKRIHKESPQATLPMDCGVKLSGPKGSSASLIFSQLPIPLLKLAIKLPMQVGVREI